MKLGTFLTVLIISLVSLGFLINDSIHTHSELATAYETAAAYKKENTQLSQQISQQSNDLLTLQTQYKAVESQNKLLSDRNALLETQNQNYSTSINRLKDQNAVLTQATADLASDGHSPFVTAALVFGSLLSEPMQTNTSVAGFVPLLVFGGGLLSYGVLLKRRKNIGSGTYMINVSKRELDAIIRHRRSI